MHWISRLFKGEKDMLKIENIFNSNLAPIFEYGYTGPGPEDAAERARARQAFEVCDVEKALTVLCGEILELEYGRDIFCGRLPEQVRNGSAVRLLAGDPGTDQDYWEGKISFFMRDRSREKVLQSCSCLVVTLPLLKWVTVNSALQKEAVTISKISLAGEPEETEVNGAGLGGTGLELIFNLQVCITPPAAEFI